ncbi:MAG: two-component regulator propeller domain-containing protein, partial [Acidobacteriota bacterium]
MLAFARLAAALSIVAVPAAADSLADDRFFHLGVEDGLGGRVLDVAQDRQGFLWFALPHGLRRWDGSRMRTFQHDPEDPHSLPDESIHRLLVDSRGDLWVAAGQSSISRWLPEDEAFERLPVEIGGKPIDLEDLGPGRLLALSEDEDAVEIRPGEPGGFRTVDLGGSHQATRDDARGALWGVGFRGVRRFDLATLELEAHFPLPKTLGVAGKLFLDATLDAGGDLWGLLYTAGAFRFEPETATFTVFAHDPEDPASLTGNDVSAVVADSGGTVWIASFSGWNRFRPASGDFARFTANPVNRRSLVNQQLHTIFEDRTGQLWLGTDVGVSRFDPLRENFRFYSHDPTRDVSAPAGSIRSFAQDELGRLWVGTRSHGLARMDRRGGETVSFSTADASGIPDDTVWALSYEAPDRLWVGGETGLSRLRISDGAWSRLPTPTDADSPRIVSFFRDRRGTLWVGGDGDIFRHDAATDAMVRVDKPVGARVLAMTDDADGRLYVGTEGDGVW